MNMKKGTLLTILALLPLLTAAQGDNQMVLKVNDRVFTRAEYLKRMEFINGVYMEVGGGFLEAPPGFITLARMINDQLIIELARSKGVYPTQAEIDKEFEDRKKGNETLFAEMAALGIPEAEMKLRATVDLAQFKLLTLGVTVTDQDVEEHYKVNPQLYTLPATIDLRVIVVRDESAKRAVDEALKTQSFEQVAKQYSTDATKAVGGDLPEVPVANLPQHIQDLFATVDKGKTTDWVQSQGAWLKYLVENKTQTQVLPLTPQLKETIRKRLMLEIGRNKNRIQDDLDELRQKANIEFGNPGMKDLYERYMRDYFRSRSGEESD